MLKAISKLGNKKLFKIEYITESRILVTTLVLVQSWCNGMKGGEYHGYERAMMTQEIMRS